MVIDYAKHVTHYRERLGVHQARFAELLEVSPGAVSSWEAGRYRPSPESIAKIESLVGLHPGEFYRPLPSYPPAAEAG